MYLFGKKWLIDWLIDQSIDWFLSLQELSLYGAMTIGETWNFFGLIHKMNYREIKERTEFLLDFLNLPSKTRLISQLR